MLAMINSGEKKEEKRCGVMPHFAPRQIELTLPSLLCQRKKIIQINCIDRQEKQRGCLFPSATFWEYLVELVAPPPMTSLYLFPFIRPSNYSGLLTPWIPTQQYLSFLRKNPTPPSKHTHTHTHLGTILPTQTESSHPPLPLFPSSNTKLPMVAMATTGVHKSERRGTFHRLKIIRRILFGGGGWCRGGGWWSKGQRDGGFGWRGERERVRQGGGPVPLFPPRGPSRGKKQMVPCGAAVPQRNPCERRCHKEAG